MNILDQPIVGVSEIGKLLGMTRQGAHQLVARADFPAPYATLDQGRSWRTAQFVRWAQKQGRKLTDAEIAA